MSVTYGQDDNYTDIYNGKMANRPSKHNTRKDFHAVPFRTKALLVFHLQVLVFWRETEVGWGGKRYTEIVTCVRRVAENGLSDRHINRKG